MKGLERRAFVVDLLEVREDGDPMIRGHAALFNSLSEDLGGFREKIEPGAFTESLSGDVRALFNHDPNYILGRTPNTLRIAEDARGLAVEIDPATTQMSEHVLTAIRRGDVSQMSFGFRTIDDKWERSDDGDIGTLLKVELFDVSPVTFPAYADTNVAVRSLTEWRDSQRETIVVDGMTVSTWRANLARKRLAYVRD